MESYHWRNIESQNGTLAPVEIVGIFIDINKQRNVFLDIFKRLSDGGKKKFSGKKVL